MNIKDLFKKIANIGDLSTLKTSKKDTLVNAVNEVKDGLSNTTEISDTTTTTTSTWSSQKISAELGKATPSDYAQVKADVEKLKSDVGTARTNLINSVNSTIDNL